MRTVSQEDYLRTIHSLYEQQKDKKIGIRSVDIASKLRISKPSVSDMIRKLVKSGYVRSKPYSAVHFTQKGMVEAKRLTHNYRVIEVFLTEVLEYPKENAGIEAHKLEHAFSEELIRRLDSYLNNPNRCPHGSIIHR